MLVRLGKILRKRGRRRYFPKRNANVSTFCPASVAPQFSLSDEPDSPVVHRMVFDLAEMGLGNMGSRVSIEVACETGFREAALEIPPSPSPDSGDELERCIPLVRVPTDSSSDLDSLLSLRRLSDIEEE